MRNEVPCTPFVLRERRGRLVVPGCNALKSKLHRACKAPQKAVIPPTTPKIQRTNAAAVAGSMLIASMISQVALDEQT